MSVLQEFLDLIESYQHEDCRFLSLKSSLSGVEENSIQQDKIQQDKIQNTQYNIQYTNIYNTFILSAKIIIGTFPPPQLL